MTYFRILCFGWAAVGIGSRLAMAVMGKRWAAWEEHEAYARQRPLWVILVSITGLFLIGLTWFMAIHQEVAYGWILALLLTVTMLKITMLLFNYQLFREFVRSSLNSKERMTAINGSVLVLSGLMIWMGLFLYR